MCCSAPDRRDAGAVSLEFALTVPALFLLVLLVLHAAVLGRDAVLVQAAARDGARVAATTTDDGAVRSTVTEALEGRTAAVSITPPVRRPGQIVRVTVTLRSRAGRAGTDLRGVAAAVVEPGVGR